MNYQSDCLCGGECQKPCIAIKQLLDEIEEEKRKHKGKK